MPGSLSRSDKKILIVAGACLMLLMAAAAIFSSPEEDTTPFPSSYAPGPRGAKAAYLLLEELGYSITRWELPLEKLPSPGQAATVLVLSDPIDRITSRHRATLASWVQQGGIVLATGYRVNSFLPDHAAKFEYETETQEFSAAAPSNLNQHIPHTTIKPTPFCNTINLPPP